MNIFKKAFCRTYQGIFYVALHFIKIPLPNLREGEGSSLRLLEDLKLEDLHRPMLFVESFLRDIEVSKPLEEALHAAGYEVTLFTGIKPNPSSTLVEEAKQVYLEHHCDCLVALGGGSTIDLAKAVGVLVAYPDKDIGHFEGVLKIHRRIPVLFAMPTTAGTGSETTLATVIVDEEKKHKYQVDAPAIIPKYAYLDGSLLAKLNPKIIASTGMDALTHALEAYIGNSNTKFTKQCAIDAFLGFKKHFIAFYDDVNNVEARNGMLRMSYDAGNAFTRAYVGYVHALAHALGGYYHVAHGLANAILLPYVLRAFGSKLNKKAIEICGYLGVEIIDKEPYEALASFIDEINARVGIPKQFELPIDDAAYDFLAAHAEKEGNPLYPVPVLKTKRELEAILRQANKGVSS